MLNVRFDVMLMPPITLPCTPILDHAALFLLHPCRQVSYWLRFPMSLQRVSAIGRLFYQTIIILSFDVFLLIQRLYLTLNLYIESNFSNLTDQMKHLDVKQYVVRVYS